MAVAVLGFSDLSVGARILRVREIVLATSGNAVYPSPSPSLAVITAAVNQLEMDELAMKSGGTGATTIRNLQNTALMGLMKTFLTYVQLTSGGDEVKIKSISLKVKGAPSASQLQGQVQKLTGKAGLFAGNTILKWGSLAKKGAKFYQVQSSADGLTAWVDAGPSITKAGTTITGLVAETVSFYRVSAGNAKGLGQWSSVIRVMAK